MENADYIKLNEILLEQEKLLRFDHFTNRDAWELGCFLVDKIYKSDFYLSVAIRKVNGAILFQHLPGSTNLNNQNWMMRKFRTVALMERSSLGVWAQSYLSEEPVAKHGLCETEYVFCGGGFPICLKNGEVVAVLTVSNLPHHKDHKFIVNALCEWLKIDVPKTDSFDF
ncbi:MAG: heme-binding protein [Treponema sp.]|jgi:uncharacterized protein (UPF0303 family)|nr:heme-binding protein [Treponema sp.]